MMFMFLSNSINRGTVNKEYTIMNYDIRFKTPFSLILSGASGSGKTTWSEHFLSIVDKITDGKGKYEKLLWFSGTNQLDLFKRSKSNFKGTTRVFDSIDNEIYSKIEKEKTPL